MNSAGIPTPPPGDNEPPDGADLARRVSVLETRFDTVLPTLATKTDIADLRSDMADLRTATRSDMADLRTATRSDMADLRTATRSDIADLRLATTTEIADLRLATTTEIADLRLATTTSIADLRTELLVKFEVLRAEMQGIASNLYKWMAATVIAILLSFAGLFVGLTRTLTAMPMAAQVAPTSASGTAPPPVVVRPQPSGPVK